jgi:hypothetical protein
VGCVESFGKLKEMVEKWVDMKGVERGEYNVNPEYSEKLSSISQKLNKVTANMEKLR